MFATGESCEVLSNVFNSDYYWKARTFPEVLPIRDIAYVKAQKIPHGENAYF